MKKFEIILQKGLGPIQFGQSPQAIVEIIGEPQEVEDIEIDENNNTTIAHYYELDTSLFFVNSRKPSLECIETSNHDVSLFGKKIFLMNEEEIIHIMKSNGYSNYEKEEEIWGESRLTFEEGMIDFYFDDNQLSVVSWGVFIDENGEILN